MACCILPEEARKSGSAGMATYGGDARICKGRAVRAGGEMSYERRIAVSAGVEKDVATVAVGGRFDTIGAPVASAAIDSLPAEATDIVFDVSEVEYMSSAGIRVILSAMHRCQDAGGSCVVRGAKPDIIATLELAGVAQFAEIEETGETGPAEPSNPGGQPDVSSAGTPVVEVADEGEAPVEGESGVSLGTLLVVVVIVFVAVAALIWLLTGVIEQERGARAASEASRSPYAAIMESAVSDTVACGW